MGKSRFTLNSAVLIGFGFGIITCVTMVEMGVRPPVCGMVSIPCFIAASCFMLPKSA